MKTFTKSDLRTGMYVTLRNGESYYVMLNTGLKQGDILIHKCGQLMDWMPLKNYDDNLRYHDDPDDVLTDILGPATPEEQAEWDIIKVQAPPNVLHICTGIDYNTIWERTL